MNVLTFAFISGMTLAVIGSLLLDWATYRPSTLRRSLLAVRDSPLTQRSLWKQLRDYNRPDFHPDDRDTTELVKYWHEQLFGDNGTLNDKLATSAA